MRAEFDQHISKITADLAGMAVDGKMETYLNERYGPQTDAFSQIETLCRQAIKEGWMCDREAGGIKFGRVTKPDAANGLSVDVVHMSDVKGPHHIHTTGEIGMIMPIADTAQFDGRGRGWYVYPPGSAHHPTVSGGDAVVLYLLPGGEIEFTGR